MDASDKDGRVPVFRADVDFEMLASNTYVANVYIVRGVARPAEPAPR